MNWEKNIISKKIVLVSTNLTLIIVNIYVTSNFQRPTLKLIISNFNLNFITSLRKKIFKLCYLWYNMYSTKFNKN